MRTSRMLLLGVTLCVIFSFAYADTYTIGDGNSSSSNAPFSGGYKYGWSKTIYTQAEISSTGLGAGSDIVGVGFYVANTVADYTMNDQRVYMRHIASNFYETTDNSYPDNDQFQLMFQGDITYSGSGWHYISFSTPFLYNGTQSIEFLFEDRGSDVNGSGNPSFRYTTTSPTYRLVYKYSYTIFPSDQTGTRSYNRPNIQLITPSNTPPVSANLVSPDDGATFVLPSIVLKWRRGDIWADGFRLYLGTDNPPTNILNSYDLASATSYDPMPDLSPATTFYWRIVPYNLYGDAINCPIWSFTTLPPFNGGSGSEPNPWQISNADQLNLIRYYLGSQHSDKHFIQTSDINLGIAPWNEGTGWLPIGDQNSSQFYGSYDGDGHIISNLKSTGSAGYNGLFGVNAGVIKELGLDNVNVGILNTYDFTLSGALAGMNLGTVLNCYSTGAVRGRYAGGLVGENGGIISECYSTVNIDGNSGGMWWWNGQHPYTGGLAARNAGTIEYCHASGNVSGIMNSLSDWGPGQTAYGTTGGLVGVNSVNATISQCYSDGAVSGSFNSISPEEPFDLDITLGGLVGNNTGTIDNSYCGGSITGSFSYPGDQSCLAGGLVGSNGGNVMNCYSHSIIGVGGAVTRGGLVGASGTSAAVNGSYWDLQASSCATSSGGEARTTDEMTYPHSQNTYVGWDWHIWIPDIDYSNNNGYLYLRPLNYTATHTPEPAGLVYPPHQSIDIMPTTVLTWITVFSYYNLDAPDGFKIWLGTDNPPTNLLSGVDLGLQYSYDPSPDLAINTTYYWKIVPYNTIGETTDCPIWNFTTFDLDNIVYYPNGNEIWQSGTTRTIRWRSDNPYGNSELHISFDNGNQWILISAVDNDKGYYHYQVPSVNSANCLVKLASTQDQNLYDISNSTLSISTSSTQPKVLLNYPSSSGTHLQVNDTAEISWIRQNVSEVALAYSTDDGQSWTEIVSGLASDSYSWLIPDTPSNECRIKIYSVVDSSVLDISDYAFSICKINLLSPNGGEVITGDHSGISRYNINLSTEAISNVQIEYSLNDGSSWTTITSTWNPSPGTYSWAVPGTPTDSGRIRISNSANNAIFDISDTTFTIRNPIRIINANGGGFITNNSMFNIRWLMQDIDPASSVYWEYSLNNTSWVRINANAVSVSDESMAWFVNTGLDDSVWLRAVKSGTNRIVGKSESSFRVTDKILMLNEPNGGENYIALTTQTISWDHNGLSSIAISYTYDDGETWLPVADDIPVADLTYSWIVPDTPSIHCRIRLQDETYSYMVLESDQNFTISPLQILDPTVDFEADSLTGDIPLSVQFSETVNPGVGNVASRLWDFGDGNTSDEENPLHVYTSPGTYTVSLSVINDFTGSSTETKEEYITALPNTPRIELLSSDSMNYGIVYLGDTSEPQVIEVRNYGTAPLHISEVSFYQANSQFSITGVTLPIEIAVEDTLEICVFFIPIANSAVSDSLYIISDASNAPVLAIKLMGVGQMVPPAATEEITIEIDGGDAHLSWLPVTTTIYGSPVTPDNYFVFCSADPFGQFTFLGATTTTQYIHQFVAAFQPRMFYHVIAYKYYGRRGFDPANILKQGMTEAEVLMILSESAHANH